MSEEENQSVEEIQEEVAHPSESTEHNDVSQEVSEAEQSKRNDAEHNWAEMRRQIREIKEENEKLKASHKPPAPPEEEEVSEYSDDDLIEGKHLKKLKEELKQIKSQLKQTTYSSMEDRIKLNYPDYHSVVTPENLKYIEENEPELAQILAKSTDAFEQRVAAYKLLKRVTPPNGENNALEKRKAQENSQKPLSVNAVSSRSPLGDAHKFENGLSKEVKQQYWNELQAAIKAG